MADTSKITLKQLKDAMNKAKNYTDNEIAGITGVSKVEPEELDMPKVFFYGNALPTSKTDVNLTMDYISNTTKFSSFVKLKCQGTSSMSYAKKNFTVSMFSDEARATKLKKDFKGWGAQSKFCLKANYVDTTHTRNLSGAKIAYDMVQSRPDSPFKQQLLTAPRNGAVDGFPIKLYFNGEFHGIYTWNIPKDAWMFNMDESNPNHCVLCAEVNNNGDSSIINSCQFRKVWNGSGEWSVEVGTASANIKASFDRCINFVMTSTDQEFHDNIGNYFDLYSLLDYYCFSYLVAHIDGLAKNMLMATYDGVIWGACLYDMDSIYGADWNGTSFKAANIQCPEQYQETNSLLWQRIERCFAAELYARYLELRQGALSLGSIIKHVEEIYDVIPDRVFADEKAKWTSLPQVANNTMTRFRNYMRDRAVYVDAQMKEIGTKVACTGITLSANNLSFTTTDSQTLTATVEPSNTTDVVTWSASPTGVVTVDNGVVTPIANGDCTITATCGSQTATCAVNVALPTVACTSISLNKTKLELGIGSGGALDYSRELTSNDLAYPTPTYNINNSGEVINGSDSYVTNAIDITNFSYISNMQVNGFGDYFNYINMVFYDADMTFISKVIGATNKIPFSIVPTNAKYVRFSMFASGTAVSDNSLFNIKFNKLVNGKTGIAIDANGYISPSGNKTNNLSEYYKVDGIQTVNLSGASWMSLVCYDENLKPIGKTSEINGASTYAGTLTTLERTKYVQVCYFQLDTGVGEVTLDIGGNTLTAVDFTSNDTNGSSMSKYQLIATVEPSNTTDVVTWSVNPTGIVTVNNGLVTAKSNGDAVITATCGSQSATCNVTVSGLNK